MVKKSVGKLESWDDADVGGSGDFVKLEEGSNIVRILTAPYQFYNHWTTDEAGQKCKVRCCLDDCPVCKRNERATTRWYVGILSRKTNKPGILEMGPQIFKAIRGLKAKKTWGDPRGYDIDITRHPAGQQPLYSVMPEEKIPLTKEETILVKKFLSECDLDAMVACPTAEEVNERLGIVSKSAPAAATEKPQEESFDFESETADDDDFNFED